MVPSPGKPPVSPSVSQRGGGTQLNPSEGSKVTSTALNSRMAEISNVFKKAKEKVGKWDKIKVWFRNFFTKR
jgi:hypothetical protein